MWAPFYFIMILHYLRCENRPSLYGVSSLCQGSARDIVWAALAALHIQEACQCWLLAPGCHRSLRLNRSCWEQKHVRTPSCAGAHCGGPSQGLLDRGQVAGQSGVCSESTFAALGFEPAFEDVPQSLLHCCQACLPVNAAASHSRKGILFRV